MFCKACGKEITDDSVYCSYCGTNQLVDRAEADKPEKTETGNPGKIKKLEKFGRVALPLAKGVAKEFVEIATPLISSGVSKSGKQIKKSFTKAAGKKTDQALKFFGWKSKTPIDSAKKIFTTAVKNKKK